MYQLILHKLRAALCRSGAVRGMRVARRGSACSKVCVCACLCVVCLFPVSNNYLLSLRAQIFFLCLSFVLGKCGANGNYTNNNNLKDPLQLIRGASWRRQPLKSISQAPLFSMEYSGMCYVCVWCNKMCFLT